MTKNKKNRITTVVIVLGADNNANGELTTLALSRANKAIELINGDPLAKLLLTGGFGKFNTTAVSHASHLKNYGINQGIQEGQILGLVESAHTVEDALLSKVILEKSEVQSIVVVTSDWHLARAKYIFECFFERSQLKFVGAESDKTANLEHRHISEAKKLGVLRKQGGVFVNGILIQPTLIQ